MPHISSFPEKTRSPKGTDQAPMLEVIFQPQHYFGCPRSWLTTVNQDRKEKGDAAVDQELKRVALNLAHSAGQVLAKFFGLRLVRATSPTGDEALDLDPNGGRQNEVDCARHAFRPTDNRYGSLPIGCAAACRAKRATLAVLCRSKACVPDAHSTVTDFARFLGWSTSLPSCRATWKARSCSGTA